MSRIEQLISDIESYIDTCKYYPLSNVKIIVNKEQLEDMLTELRLKTPDEVKKYQKILSNKDAILADAKEISRGYRSAHRSPAGHGDQRTDDHRQDRICLKHRIFAKDRKNLKQR